MDDDMDDDNRDDNMDNGLWMIIWMMMAEECRHQLCLPLFGGRRRPRQGHLVRPAPRHTHPPRPDQLSVCYEFSILSEHVTTTKLIW